MNWIIDFWSWLTATVPVAPVVWLVVLFLVGCAAAATPPVWHLTRLFATYVHEAGHAVVAILTGRRVTRIRLEADTSGTTEHIGAANGFGRFITAFAGYPAPALAGWGIVVALSDDKPRWVLAGFALLAVGLLLLQRSWRGWLVTLVVGFSVYLLNLAGSEWASLGLALTAGYLLIASPRTVIELHLIRRRAKANLLVGGHSDADALASQTGLPPIVWEILFMIVCIWAIVDAFRRLVWG